MRTVPFVPRNTPSGTGTPLYGGPSAGTNANTRRTGTLPKLTEGERKLLEQSKGCLKCRKVNAGHFAKACPDGFPNPANYRNLVTGKATVAAIAEVQPGAIETDIVDISHVAVINSTSSTPSCVLTSDDEDWESDKYVRPPLTLPHIVWNTRLHSPSSLENPIEMLIDTGCTTVLIREDIVIQHNLRRRPLHKPFQYRAAFGAEVRSSSEKCRLRVSTPDFSWSSISVDAIIVPELCSPVILGLPFYHINKLLIAPAHRTLVCPDGRDLLRPSRAIVHDVRNERQRRHDQRQEQHDWKILEQEKVTLESMMHETQHKDVIRELNLRFGINKCKTTPEPPPESVVAAIQRRIGEIALLDILARENKQMRSRFADCFPDDIPHVNELPTDVYHRFCLKDPNAVIARRQYECPKKYREDSTSVPRSTAKTVRVSQEVSRSLEDTTTTTPHCGSYQTVLQSARVTSIPHPKSRSGRASPLG